MINYLYNTKSCTRFVQDIDQRLAKATAKQFYFTIKYQKINFVQVLNHQVNKNLQKLLNLIYYDFHFSIVSIQYK